MTLKFTGESPGATIAKAKALAEDLTELRENGHPSPEALTTAPILDLWFYTTRKAANRAGPGTPAERSPVTAAVSDANEIPISRWWRDIPRWRFSRDDRRVLRDFLSSLAVLDDPNWFAAARGSPPACVASALRRLKTSGSIGPVESCPSSSLYFDLAATALLGAALDGDRACQTVLASLIRYHRPVDGLTRDLISSWLGKNHPFLIDYQPVCWEQPTVDTS